MYELNGKVLCTCKDIVKAFYALIENNSSAYSEIIMAFMELAHIDDVLRRTELDTDDYGSVFLNPHGCSASHAPEFHMRWHTAATGD